MTPSGCLDGFLLGGFLGSPRARSPWFMMVDLMDCCVVATQRVQSSPGPRLKADSGYEKVNDRH